MKRLILAGVVLAVFAACSDNAGSTEAKIDSLEERIDTTLEKAGDSINAKAQELKKRIKEKWSNRKDSGKRGETEPVDSLNK